VRCFWCDGAPHDWEVGDDAWTEHARWYPGCRHVFLVKGPAFIRKTRAATSAEDVRRAADLQYNDAGTDFLTSADAATVDDGDDDLAAVRQQDWYVVLNGLGFSTEELDALARVRTRRRDPDVDVDVAKLVDALLDRRNDVRSDRTRDVVVDAIEALTNKLERMNIDADTRHPHPSSPPPPPPPRFLDLVALVAECVDDATTDRDALTLVATMTCELCSGRVKDSVTLPCGHLLYCSSCVAGGVTPNACLVCRRPIRGVCRVYLA
jgi:hypothetical protein